MTSFEWAIAIVGAGSLLFSLWLRVLEEKVMQAKIRHVTMPRAYAGRT